MATPGDGVPECDIAVVGAGLTGSMVALLLARAGHRLTIIEKRADLRADLVTTEFGQMTNPNKRSINLALSHRGIEALKAADLFDRVQPLLIAMEGRCIHSLDGPAKIQPYGHAGQAIYSVARSDLNAFLLDALAATDRITFRFETTVERIQPDGKLTTVDRHGNKQVVSFDMIVGADGAFSSVRDSMSKCSRVNVSQEFLSAGYKELTIPAGSQGEFALASPNNLHIWPRHARGMLIALPNRDRSFTATLFAPWADLDALDADPSSIGAYFTELYPDFVDLIGAPDLVAQVHAAPSSPLVTVKCSPWNTGVVVLLGDAAHAVVPFYGQGMNAGFEDALLFADIWARHARRDVRACLEQFNRERQPAGIALADLSLENFVEMSSKTDSFLFRAKKRVEAVLHAVCPKAWVPLYTMVSFTRTPYDVARRRALVQDRIFYSAIGVVAVASAAAVAVCTGRRR
ncbi:FAD-binding domain-containing protein [Plasmodiophora brassicae]